MASVTPGAGGLAVGETLTTRSLRLTADDIVAFATDYDPQPMHLDAAAAKASFFGDLVASGWHVLSLTMRLAVEARPFGDSPLIGMGVNEIRFLRPAPPGIEIAVRLTLDETRARKAGGHYGFVSVETIEVGSGDALIRQKWRMLLT